MSSYYYSEEAGYGGRDYRVTRAVQRLILLNAVVFAVQLLLEVPFGGLGGFAPPGGLISALLSFQPISFMAGMLWQPLTYMFLHANLMHLFFNMLWLYFFGPDVERVLGTRQFAVFYILCGALGVFATFVPLILGRVLPFFPAGNVSVVGASGAVMGVLIAFAMVNPHRQFFMFPIPAPINARLLVAIVIVINLLNAGPGSPTSVATHFGGMAVGYAYMKFIPYFRDRQRIYWQKRRQSGGRQSGGRQDGGRQDDGRQDGGRKPSGKDTTGEQVDNIFRFDKHKRN